MCMRNGIMADPTGCPVPRIAIYNAYLPTLGGGELCTLMTAAVLAERGHEVDLLALSGTTLAQACARFGVAVPPERVRLRSLEPARHDREAEELSAHYDAFLNLTHDSRVVN